MEPHWQPAWLNPRSVSFKELISTLKALYSSSSISITFKSFANEQMIEHVNVVVIFAWILNFILLHFKFLYREICNEVVECYCFQRFTNMWINSCPKTSTCSIFAEFFSLRTINALGRFWVIACLRICFSSFSSYSSVIDCKACLLYES